MSRRTFPRAVAAGLVAVGFTAPAPAQTPNPWRGEPAALPTAPAPRTVHTGQLIIGVGFNSTAGLTGSIVVREATALPVAPAPRPVCRSACVDLDVVACPAANADHALPQARATAAPVEITYVVTPAPADTPLKRVPHYLTHSPTYFPPEPVFPLPRELATRTDPVAPSTLKPLAAPVLRTVEYAVPAPARFMPPPAPLPVPLPHVAPTPAGGDVIVPITFDVAFPPKGTPVVSSPTANSDPRAQGRQ